MGSREKRASKMNYRTKENDFKYFCRVLSNLAGYGEGSSLIMETSCITREEADMILKRARMYHKKISKGNEEAEI